MVIYFIGGSPCSGKSTVAQILADRHCLRYFKVDDHLDRYLQTAAAQGKPACQRATQMTPDEIWMRDPQLQCEEELRIYEEIFDLILADLAALGSQQDIITEGAAYLPMLMQRQRIAVDRYLSITPTKDFQVTHYRQREWVPYVLEGCRDKETAFRNWMERDALFALTVQQQCMDAGYVSIVNDGGVSVEDMVEMVAGALGLSTL